MKITIEVNNEAIEKNVTDLVCNQLAAELYKELRGSRGESLTYRYHVEIRKIVREVMKENYDALAKEAVSAAAKSIENKALKEKIRSVLEGECWLDITGIVRGLLPGTETIARKRGQSLPTVTQRLQTAAKTST